MLDAAAIAGLNCIRLITETAATALCYGIYKHDLPDVKEQSRTVVIVDMGHASMQCTLVGFNKGKVRVRAVVSDASVGGRDFDRALYEHFANDFAHR